MMQSTWKNRIVAHGELPPEQLLANPLNWRIHPTEQQDAMQAVLEHVGVVQQVIVNKRTGNLVDGHLRVMLAMRGGIKKLPVIYIDVSAKDEKMLLATIDTITEMAQTDREKLQVLLDDLSGMDGVDDLLAGIRNDLVDNLPKPKKEKKPITCPECGAVF